MFIIGTNLKLQENKYILTLDAVTLTAYNKKGTEFAITLDTQSMKKVKSFGTWFVEWNKDYNNYLVYGLSDSLKNKKGKPFKICLANLLLDIHEDAPVTYIDGDYLNNSISNLKVYDRNSINEYTLMENGDACVTLKNKFGVKVSSFLISKEDISSVINENYSWTLYKGNVIANTEDGRIYLNSLLLNPDKDHFVYYINLNKLDNRRHNLKLKKIDH